MNLPRTRLLAVAACLVVGAPMAAATAGASSGPVAHAATATCHNLPQYGNGYYNKLVVTGTSCASGKTVMVAHHKCRVKHGVKGYCKSVLGYSCTEYRKSISTEFNSRVTCKNGSRKVVYYYTQNL